MPKRLPISVAKAIAQGHDCEQVIVVAWDGKLTHIVSYGKSVKDCDQAAQGADFVKDALGWPDSLKVMPSRVDKLSKQVEELKAENKELRGKST